MSEKDDGLDVDKSKEMKQKVEGESSKSLPFREMM